MPTPRQYREDCARRFADRLGVDGEQLVAAADAAWSNLNPQSVSYQRALSVAGVALRAADRVTAARRAHSGALS